MPARSSRAARRAAAAAPERAQRKAGQPVDWQRPALFAAAAIVLSGTLFFGIALRVSLANDIPKVARGGLRQVIDGGVGDLFGTAMIVALAAAAYLVCLWVLRKGFRHSFAAAIGATVLGSLAMMPSMPLTSPDAVHLAADVRTFWLYGKMPTSFSGAPGRIDDPVANEVRVYRNAPSGYGPLAYVIGGAPIPFAGDNFRANLLGQKVVAATFLIITATLAGLIARNLGQNPGFVAGLIGLNPLMLWQYPGDGHNDTIMAAFGMLALWFLIRPGWKNKSTGVGAAIAAVLSKFGLALAAPVVGAWLFPRWRFAMGLLVALGGGALLLSFILGVAPVNGTIGPAGAVAVTTPWGVLANVLDTGQSGSDRIVVTGYVLYLGIASWVVMKHPLQTPEDLIRAVALLLWIFLFACSPGYLAWYQVWYLPFAALSNSRWMIATMLAFSLGAFVPILTLSWGLTITRELSIENPLDIAVISVWIATAAVALGFWRGWSTGSRAGARSKRGRAPAFAPRTKKARA